MYLKYWTEKALLGSIERFNKYFPFQLHNYLEEQGYQYVGTLGGKHWTLLNQYVFPFPDSDDIFITLEMWNGSYYFDKRNLSKSWQKVFSYHKETANSQKMSNLR